MKVVKMSGGTAAAEDAKPEIVHTRKRHVKHDDYEWIFYNPKEAIMMTEEANRQVKIARLYEHEKDVHCCFPFTSPSDDKQDEDIHYKQN